MNLSLFSLFELQIMSTLVIGVGQTQYRAIRLAKMKTTKTHNFK